ncbi:hypothetical protein GALMADRAFT_549650 [Galerina marginata CBS 339.88]|uniref:Uncharacterized protein n=1 Tax=Galerina marginata (strain CBS 339.88) TaxID=685588 RepID=A0A067SZ66_GALM3|nr:hypothetical protein GALMADRAFT_549650 [Galerina marginata CBS 339.88]
MAHPPSPSSTLATLSPPVVSPPPGQDDPSTTSTEDTVTSNFTFSNRETHPFMQTIRPSSVDVASTASETPSDIAQDNCSTNAGRSRFPNIPVSQFDYADDYGHRYRECHPGKFNPVIFKYHWDLKPFVFLPKDHTIVMEEEFRGVRFRVHPVPGTITGIITRGTTLVIGGQNDTNIKYMATIRRAMGPESSLVQINAYNKNQQLYRADHPSWPVLLLSVPNRFCDVPLHRSIAPYYKTYFIKLPQATLMQRIVRSILSFIRRPLFPPIIENATNDTAV